MQEAVQILTGARRLIAEESNWIQGFYSKNKKFCGITYGKCFCMLGAVDEAEKRAGLSAYQAFQSLRQAVREQSPFSSPIGFNDAPGRKHEEVLQAFDRAIEIASAI